MILPILLLLSPACARWPSSCRSRCPSSRTWLRISVLECPTRSRPTRHRSRSSLASLSSAPPRASGSAISRTSLGRVFSSWRWPNRARTLSVLNPLSCIALTYYQQFWQAYSPAAGRPRSLSPDQRRPARLPSRSLASAPQQPLLPVDRRRAYVGQRLSDKLLALADRLQGMVGRPSAGALARPGERRPQRRAACAMLAGS